MPSPHERRRNNVKAGIFVSLSIVLAVVTILALTEAWDMFASRTTYVGRYPVAAGVSNLQQGAEVRVGGVPLGSVVAVRPRTDDRGAFGEIDVEFDVDSSVTLFSDAKVFVTSALLGDNSWLDVTAVGTPANTIASGDVIAGAETVGMLNTLLGPENAAHTTAILAHAEVVASDARAVSGFLATLPQEYEERVAPALDDARATAADAKAVVGDLRAERWPKWSGQVDGLLAWAEGQAEDIAHAITNADGTITDVREIVSENRGSVGNTISSAERAAGNLEDATVRFRDETIDRFHAVLEEGEHGVAELAGAIEKVRTDYDAWAVGVDDTLDNLRHGSGELKLALTEIRRSPWKAFHKPGREELEHELLYESARSFLLATADLRAAADATERVLREHGQRLADDGELAGLVERNLVEPLQKYEKAQQRLLDVLAVDGP